MLVSVLQNLTTIDLVISEIICLIKIRTDDRQPETGDLFFRTLETTNRQENIKTTNRPTDSITTLP